MDASIYGLQNEFDEKHSLGTAMHGFLKRILVDAKLLDETGFSKAAELIEKLGYETKTSWGLSLQISAIPRRSTGM